MWHCIGAQYNDVFYCRNNDPGPMLNLVHTTADLNDIYMNCQDVSQR